MFCDLCEEKANRSFVHLTSGSITGKAETFLLWQRLCTGNKDQLLPQDWSALEGFVRGVGERRRGKREGITSFKWKTFFISCFEWKGSWSCRLRAAPFDIWGLLGILDSENSAVLKYYTSDNVDPTSRKLLQLAVIVCWCLCLQQCLCSYVSVCVSLWACVCLCLFRWICIGECG